MTHLIDIPNLAAILALAAIFASLVWMAPRFVRAIRRKLAILALTASLALTPSPAFAEENYTRTVVGITLSTLVLFVLYHVAENMVNEDGFVDDESNRGSSASFGSFRLSEHAGNSGQVQTHPPLSARNDAPKWEGDDLLSEARRNSESGLFGEWSRIPAGALVKINGLTLTQSGWSIRPTMDAAPLRDTGDAKFLLRLEREF